jgi:hypothetical protein
MATRKSPPSIYQIKITLREISPPIWRRVQVPSNMTLGDLHWVIQTAMGWTNSHLHSFTIDGVEYGMILPDELGFDDIETHDENLVKLNKIIPGEKYKFPYLYDVGDSWEHDILVEKVLPVDPATTYPTCLQAKRACPPEDCGGTSGYAQLLEVMQNPHHDDYESMLEWLGGAFSPEAVDLQKINLELKHTWQQISRGK